MLEPVYQPFAASPLVVVIGVLLDLYVSEVPLEVLDVVSVVGLVRKTGETLPIQPGCQLRVVSAEAVNPQVEFLAPEKQGPGDILLDDVRLCRGRFLFFLLLRFFLLILRIGLLFLFLVA